MKRSLFAAVFFTLFAGTVHAADVVRLGNLKFAHYGAVWYMKEIAPKYNLKIDERMFAKGLDIIPAVVAGEIDIADAALQLGHANVADTDWKAARAHLTELARDLELRAGVLRRVGCQFDFWFGLRLQDDADGRAHAGIAPLHERRGRG